MSDVVIRAEGLGKKFVISHASAGQRGGYQTLREAAVTSLKSLFKRNDVAGAASTSEEFWALKDINFEIKRGEAVGIIGRNGAGKSTLLKVLSRITEPTEGRVTIKGRVASLLEVGTGFHPELTGRENIFLNGAILGMTRVEIRKKFDEIVDFAGVERFIDTPVKRYSSGMYVRLAFSVAAHLEPEILVVDEVLAVGDQNFQTKCLGKLDSISNQEGRTVLFVSHNLEAIRRLCPRSMMLNEGRKDFDGQTPAAIKSYIHGTCSTADTYIDLSKAAYIQQASIQTQGANVSIVFDLSVPNDWIEPVFGIVIKDDQGVNLIGINNRHIGFTIKADRGQAKLHIQFSEWPFFGDRVYSADIYYGDSEDNRDTLYDCIKFRVVNDAWSKGKPITTSLNLVSPRFVRFAQT